MSDASRVEAISNEMFSALGTERQFSSLDASYATLHVTDAYRVTKIVSELRQARGEKIIGRKIGFTNEEVWGRRGFHPMWGFVYDKTMRSLADAQGVLSLNGFVEPRIEPEIVFGLKSEPGAGMDDIELLATIEWAAQGFEVVQSRFPGWRFTEAEAIAAYALHGFLLIGERKPIARDDRHDWARSLSMLEVDLVCDGKVIERGHARNVLGGPLSALRRLLEILAADAINPPLATGEIVTTGTLTGVPPITAGETWATAMNGTELKNISVRFT